MTSSLSRDVAYSLCAHGEVLIAAYSLLTWVQWDCHHESVLSVSFQWHAAGI